MTPYRIHHRITLFCKLYRAQHLLLSSKTFLPVQSLAYQNVTITAYGSDDGEGTGSRVLDAASITRASLEQDITSKTRPKRLPWPPLDRRECAVVEGDEACVHATFFQFEDLAGGLKFRGSQFANCELGVVLLHCYEETRETEQWKLRLVSELPGEEAKVRVEETIWGEAPFWMALPLWVTGSPQRELCRHMELYDFLLAESEEEEGQ